MKKILTIVIPTYNMQDYLDRCLSSLIVGPELMQQLEVLVVNDGSKDNSSSIAHGYQDKYPDTYRVIEKENGNYGSCVNRGLAEAKGKFIKVLDADDWFDTQEFEKLLDRLLEIDVDLVLTPFDVIDGNGTIVARFSQSIEEGVCYDFNTFSHESIIKYSMHMVTYRTEVLRNIEYKQTEGISYTDTEWTHIPQFAIRQFAYYPFRVYQYRTGREGQTMDSSVLIRNIWKYETIIKSLVDNMNRWKSSNVTLAEVLNLQQIVHLASNIYKIVMVLGHPSTEDLLRLKQFDGYLKEACPFAYEETAKLPLNKRIPIRYVSLWRRTGIRLPIDALREVYERIRNRHNN